jgi:hypothetical protein
MAKEEITQPKQKKYFEGEFMPRQVNLAFIRSK